jgi:Phosphotransferase enzyme family
MRAFVDSPIGDVDAATALAKRAAAEWDLADPTLLRTGMNAIFVAGNTVLRVGCPNAPATASIELAERLTDEGLRVTQPLRVESIEQGELSVTCWERIESTGASIDWVEVGRMVQMVHDLDVAVVPPDYPLPTPSTFPWWDFSALLADTGHAIDDRARAGLSAAVERWPMWSTFDDPVVCHGDVHPGNVIMSNDGPVLIDWDLMCTAPRGWDHAPMMTWTSRWGGAAGVYEQFAEGYGQSLRGDEHAEAFAELRLVAATLMRVKAGLRNDAAMPEAQRRLGYWRGELSAPPWQAQ